MGINEAALKALLAALSDDNGGDENKNPPVAPVPSPPAPEADKEKAELEKRLAELEAKLQEDPAKVEDKDKNKKNAEVEELRKRVREQEDVAVTASIKEGLGKAEIDAESFDVLSEFIEYDKLKGEDGSVDEEKIAKIVDTLTGIALRNPPSGPKKKAYDPLNQGLGRYLDS